MVDILKCSLNAILIGVVANLILPLIFKQFASAKEIKPPNGAENLTYREQFVHMMVHHGQVPLVSSAIVAIIIGVSIFVGHIVNPSRL